jgi:23S rRNA pseudouridine1911/1915/1917 synthase
MFELPRQALHAAVIEFPHPDTRDTVRVESPLPPDLREYLDAR